MNSHFKYERVEDPNIPKNIRYQDLSAPQTAVLDEWILDLCKKLAHRARHLTSGALEMEDTYHDLIAHSLYIKKKITGSRSTGKLNVVSFFKDGLWKKHMHCMDEYYDNKSMEEYSRRAMYEHMLDDASRKGMVEVTNKRIDLIREAAAEIGVVVNTEDWVGTAMRVILKGVRERGLHGRLLRGMQDLEVELASNGYAPENMPDQRRRGTLLSIVRSYVRNDPKIKPAEIARRLRNREIPHNPDSVGGLASRARFQLGLRPHNASIGREVLEIYRGGNSDIRSVLEELRKRGHRVRPSYIRAILNKALREREAG